MNQNKNSLFYIFTLFIKRIINANIMLIKRTFKIIYGLFKIFILIKPLIFIKSLIKWRNLIIGLVAYSSGLFDLSWPNGLITDTVSWAKDLFKDYIKYLPFTNYFKEINVKAMEKIEELTNKEIPQDIKKKTIEKISEKDEILLSRKDYKDALTQAEFENLKELRFQKIINRITITIIIGILFFFVGPDILTLIRPFFEITAEGGDDKPDTDNNNDILNIGKEASTSNLDQAVSQHKDTLKDESESKPSRKEYKNYWKRDRKGKAKAIEYLDPISQDDGYTTSLSDEEISEINAQDKWSNSSTPTPSPHDTPTQSNQTTPKASTNELDKKNPYIFNYIPIKNHKPRPTIDELIAIETKNRENLEEMNKFLEENSNPFNTPSNTFRSFIIRPGKEEWIKMNQEELDSRIKFFDQEDDSKP